MAGQTIVEKCLARASGRDRVEPGEYIEIVPDHCVCMELVWPMHRRNMARVGVDNVARPDKTVLVVDHTTSAAMGTDYWKAHRDMRAFAERNGIASFFGPGSGLRHHILAEKGFARPGAVIFGDEQNIASIGALGALCIPIGPEIFVPLVTDRNWLMVPKTARFRLTGALPRGSTVRDLAQIILRDYASGDALLQHCVEFCGPGLRSLSLDERQSLCACVYHTGADTAICEVDDAVRDHVARTAPDAPFAPVTSDPDAAVSMEVTYDLSAVEPTVTAPPELSNGGPVAAVAGRRITQATIGSCAGGRLDDMRAAAHVLRGRAIDPGVTMYITPGSREVYADAAAEGLIEVFARAGATVLAPGCTTCWGYHGLLSDGEVAISTNQFNYHGRQGSEDAEIYLAGPLVVAASAVAGEIADPRPYLDAED
ncbi:hypothetical protein HKCCE2091_03400 [Rhodobacterales bacterium HKCCE2091]|nr:hypothetical protein [Rhodobacterales bacterium HKCCE2091]